VFDRLLKRIGVVTKYDLNEYARRFIAGDNLPTEGDLSVSPESAMRIATVFACVRVLAETIASLPCRVYEQLPGGGAEEAPDHALYDLLYRRPNKRQTAFEFFEMLVGHLALRGNGVCIKVTSGGKVTDLVPVPPNRVRIEQFENQLLIYHLLKNDGTDMPLVSDDIFHIRGLCSDGYWGASPIAQAKDTFALARKVQRYGVSIFDSGGARRVLLKYPKPLSDQAYKRIKEDWERLYANNAKTALLEEGGDAALVGMNADEAQYLDTRRMSREEICGIFRVPPHMVADLSRATYSNIDKQDLFFVKHTIRPWLKRIEGAISRDLLGPGKYFVKFNVDALLRGDIKTRTAAQQVQFTHGAITLNEWRAMENRNPIAGEIGDEHFVPNNLIPAERILEEPEIQPEPADDPGEGGGMGGTDNEPEKIFLPIAADIAERLVGAEVRDAGKGDFWAFYDRHRIYAFKASQPLFAAAAIDDDTRRAALADAVLKGLAEGCEIDIAQRTKRITALLMAEVDERNSMVWQARAIAALGRIEKQSVDCE